MRKIPTVLVRDPDNRAKVLEEVTPGCEWVLAGEGVPTRKYDGTCVSLDMAKRWWARREVKPGKTPPSGFIVEEHDETTGKTVGWEPMTQSPFAKFHAQALETLERYEPGTYELVGPKINGNPERLLAHELVRHSDATPIEQLGDGTPRWGGPRGLMHLVRAVGELGWEGVVWHHPDGRMAKLKVRDLP